MRKSSVLIALLIFACSSDSNNINNSFCGGETYESMVYGSLVWAVENTCITTYRDGTPIPQVSDDDEWASLNTGAWCYYNNDSTKPRLYNWYAVAGIFNEESFSNPNLRKDFAPDGWHVPSIYEWIALKNYLISNGYNYDGATTENKIAKSMASTTGWDSSTDPGAPGNNQSLNNSSGFNAYPYSSRDWDDGGFNYEGGDAAFWSISDEGNQNEAYFTYLLWNYHQLGRPMGNKRNGLSVRFVKN